MPKKRNCTATQSKLDILCSLQDLSVTDVPNFRQARANIKQIRVKSLVASASEDQRVVDDLVLSEHISEEEEQSDRPPKPLLSGTKRKRRKSSIIDEESACYIEIHVDIWTLIGAFIRPEDVGRFAAICRTTAFVISRAGFWSSLYDRYCSNCLEMPDELRPWEVRNNNIVGLRSRVIRSLFLAYEPLSSTRAPALVKGPSLRRAHHSTSSFSADKLLHSRCTVFWHQRRGTSHQYVFKFFHSDRIPNQALFGSEFWLSSHRPMTMPPACLHPEDGCYLLEIVCSNPCKVDHLILGLRLQLMCEKPAEITDSHMNKITLVFSQYTYTAHTRRDDGIKVVLQPVVSVQVVPWWDQKYYSTIWFSESAGNGNSDKDPDDDEW